KAPEGYEKLNQPINFKIDETKMDYVITVKNSKSGGGTPIIVTPPPNPGVPVVTPVDPGKPGGGTPVDPGKPVVTPV
ncbi:hypothetical protein AB3491_13305, partial [Macrococcus capreoli]